MRRFSQKTSLVTLNEINITPLLDLAFVLLIIFVIISGSIKTSEEHGMQLNLPKGGAPVQKVNKSNVRVVEIDPRGRIMLDRNRVTLDQLEKDLNTAAAANPKLVVKVRADQNVVAKDFYGVFEVLQRNGISLGLETEGKKK